MKKRNDKQIDFNFAKEVAALEDGKVAKNCIQCGICTSSCPVAKFVPEFNPRKIIARALLGLKEEVLAMNEIWYCSRCQYCIANCMKDIAPGDIIMALRNIAIKEGYTETPGARHTLIFLEDLKRRGKLDEAFLPLKTLRFGMIGLIPLALRMFMVGKVPLPLMKSVEGHDEVKALIEEFKD